MKIQTKTALLFTLLTAGMMLLLSLLVYLLATQFTFQDFKKRLQLRAIVAAKVWLERDETGADAFEELQRQHLELLPHQMEYLLPVDSASRRIRLKDSLHLPASFYESVLQNREAYYDLGPVTYAGIYYQDNQGDFVVIASAVNEYGAESLQILRTIFLACVIGGMFTAYTVGLFFSRRTFAPVRRLVEQMKNITGRNLHLRLPPTDGTDEISELTQTFNNMLDRLETAFETQDNFISNASHELSTPLTVVIGEAELALSRKRTTAEYEKAISVILQEAERLRQLTSGLLNLAQNSYHTQLQQQEMLRIDELLFEVVETVERLEPAARLQLGFDNMPADESRLQLKGNREMLRLALSNIVLNGCKYSGNQPVRIRPVFTATAIEITVADQGIGIPARDLPHIFTPFFRASNANVFKGHGIGLPLSANILRQHRATIRVTSEEGKGTTLILHFPRE